MSSSSLSSCESDSCLTGSPLSSPSNSIIAGDLSATVATTVSSASVKIGRWTKQEHAKFMEAYKLFGKDWRRVAEYVGTRNNVQVRTHAQKSFKKLRNQEIARLRSRDAALAHRRDALLQARISEQFDPLRLHQHLPTMSALYGSSFAGMAPTGELLAPIASPSYFAKQMLDFNAAGSPLVSQASPPTASPLFSFNGAVLPPHLSALAPLTANQLPAAAAPNSRFSFQNHFKFFQGVDVN